ncbi:hypothetical protein VPH35_012999 [Triticum aestivum]
MSPAPPFPPTPNGNPAESEERHDVDRGDGAGRRRAGPDGAEPPGAGHPRVDLRRWHGRRRQDHLQLHRLHLRLLVRVRHLQRPCSSSSGTPSSSASPSSSPSSRASATFTPR